MGRNGMVTSAHYLASLAGARVLMDGGNAVDAAVATAATLNVVEPYMSGLGGDGLMSISLPGQRADRAGLQRRGAGAASAASLSAAETLAGPKSPLVPGAAGGWLAALERYGSWPASRVFADAIRLAEDGAPVSFLNTEFIALAAHTIRPSANASATFIPDGAPPRPGSVLRQPNLARTLRRVAEGGADVFYHGELGREVVAATQAAGGLLTEATWPPSRSSGSCR